jgi:hypothetical protein
MAMSFFRPRDLLDGLFRLYNKRASPMLNRLPSHDELYQHLLRRSFISGSQYYN